MQIPQLKDRLYGNWEGYDGEMEDYADNREVRVLMPAIPPMNVLVKKPSLPAVKWVMAPIKSSARTDGLVLNHWVKATEKGMLTQTVGQDVAPFGALLQTH
jgi:hypothetical protein